MITTEDGGYTQLRGVLWRRCLDATQWLIGRDWRRVFTLALGVLALGVLLVIAVDDQVWDEVGTGLIGGSVVGLVFAIAQHTLDLQAVERQVAHEVRLTVSSSGDLQGIDLAGEDLSAAHLLRKQLQYAHLDGARLVGADLRASDLSRASLRGADLRRADLRGSSLVGAVLDGADLAGAELPAGGLTDARLVGAVLTGARLLAGSRVEAGEGPEADEGGASLRVDLSGATLDDARLPRAVLPEVRASFLSARRADAAEAVLRGGDLSCADLRGASLSCADLRKADLSGADLRGAVMSRADLRGARLVGARLERADLTGAVVDGADLRAADLRGAYLTNVDLAATRMDGARVRASDLEPAETRPDPATCFVPAESAALSRGAAGEVEALALVAPGELRSLAEAVAGRLRDRRAGLERVNGDLEAIHLSEESPHAGEPADHGLPRSVAVRHRPPRRPGGRLWAELRGAGTGGRGPAAEVEVVVHVPGGGVAVVGREPWGAGDRARAAGRLASAVQAALADPEAFVDADEVDAFAAWLERPEAPAAPALAEVLARNPRNPVALLLRAFSRESSDVHDMDEASDEVRTVWAVSRSDTVRALAATRLAWAQAQVLHRAADSAPVLARSRSAADVALRLFDGLEPRRGSAVRLLVLRTKAESAWAFSRAVTEQPDDLQAGIARYRRCVRLLERRGLTVSPRVRNSLAYCLMAAAGRFTPGPGAGYAEAIDQLRELLAYYGLREEADPGDDGTRRTTVAVRTLARRAAAGEGPPADRLLRERSLRLGLVNLGNMHRLEKRFDAALDCYGAAIYCNPDYVEAYAERAWVHLERADRRSADADIRRALARDVGTPQQKARILVGYVDALERVGLEAEQGRWLDEARERDPGSPRVEALTRRWKERFGGSE